MESIPKSFKNPWVWALRMRLPLGERWRKGILGSQRLDLSLLFPLALFLTSDARADTRRLFFCVQQRGELEAEGWD